MVRIRYPECNSRTQLASSIILNEYTSMSTACLYVFFALTLCVLTRALHGYLNLCIECNSEFDCVHEEDTSTGHRFARTHGILLSIVKIALDRREPLRTTIFQYTKSDV